MFLPKVFTTVTPLSKTIAAILFILLPFLAFYLGMQYQKSLTPSQTNTITSKQPDGVACTMDTKICPDGSTVGRIPPTCEFDLCPISEQSSSSRMYTNDILHYTVEIPPGWEVSDEPFLGEQGEASIIPPELKDCRAYCTHMVIISPQEPIRYSLDTQQEFVEWLVKNVSNSQDQRLFKVGNRLLDGYNAVEFVSRTLPGDPTEAFYSTVTWFRKEGRNYYIEFGGDEEIVRKYLNEYYTILESFVFHPS